MPVSTTSAPIAIAIALLPERLVEPDVLAVLALSTVGVVLVALGIPPGAVSPPPSEPPPDGDGVTDGALAVAGAEVTLVEALAECWVLPAASTPAGAKTAPSSQAEQATAHTWIQRPGTQRSDASGCSIAGVVGGRL
jgi:hypothetical protein